MAKNTHKLSACNCQVCRDNNHYRLMLEESNAISMLPVTRAMNKLNLELSQENLRLKAKIKLLKDEISILRAPGFDTGW